MAQLQSTTVTSLVISENTGTASDPQFVLTANAEGLIQRTGFMPPSGGGTTSYVPRWTTGSALGNSQIFDDGTNVGVGTTSPSSKLDVSGTIRNSAAVNLAISTGNVVIGSTESGSLKLEVSNSDALINNVRVGRGTGFICATNTVLGSCALQINFCGQRNTAVGYKAMCKAFGTCNNTAIGYKALYSQVNLGNNTAIGMYALLSNIDGVGSIAIGSYALCSNITGRFNNAVGGMALRYNTGGFSNIAFGYSTLLCNTTGCAQVAIGHHALCTSNFAATSANANVAIGYRALRSTTTGCQNTALGTRTLISNTAGSFNTAIGNDALFCNTTGACNIAIGPSASFNNTTGSSNVAIGVNSLFTNTTGRCNVAIGNHALCNNSIGVGNVAIGASASFSNLNGGYNTAIGFSSLFNNRFGFSNIAIGRCAMFSNYNGVRNIAIGTYALQANRTGRANIAIGYAALKCAIGVDSPSRCGSYNTAIGCNALACNTLGYFNVAIGPSALYRNCLGHGNIAIGGSTLVSNTNGTHNIGFGCRALISNTTGSYNFGAGQNALEYNQGGSHNFSVGKDSMKCNISGCNNTAFGRGSLCSNTLGCYNIGFGYNALRSNRSGIGQIAIGRDTLCASNFAATSANANVAVGYRALRANTTGTSNTAIGTRALQSNTTGFCNIAIGNDALFSNTTGRGNVAIGASASFSNTTGSDNTAIGRGALRCNTYGYNNTAIGYRALCSNTTGLFNTAIGCGALCSNTYGSDNTAIGRDALRSNTTGSDNIAIGRCALQDNTTGCHNTAIGFCALHYNIYGIYNTAIGRNALGYNAYGCHNTAIGRGALFCNTYGCAQVAIGNDALRVSNFAATSANANVAVGYRALCTTTTGCENTALGTRTLISNTTGSFNTAIGNDALFSTTTGACNIAIGPSASFANTTGSSNVAIGVNSLFTNTTGCAQVAIGQSTLVNSNTNTTSTTANIAVGSYNLCDLTTGNRNLALGTRTGLGITTGIANTIVGSNVTGLAAGLSCNIVIADGLGNVRFRFDGTDHIFTNQAGEVARMKDTGNVGIGLTAPTEKLHVSGNLRVTGAFVDSNNSSGTSGQVLASTVTGTDWITLSEITGVTGSGTTNYVSKFTNTTSVGNSQIFDNGTNVGIGTTGPAYKLDVSGTLRATSITSNTDGSASAPVFNFINSTTSGIFSPGSNQVAISSNGSTRMNFRANGDIEVATSGWFVNSVGVQMINLVQGYANNPVQMNGVYILPRVTNGIGLIVSNLSGQTSPSFAVTTFGGSAMFRVEANGSIGMRSESGADGIVLLGTYQNEALGLRSNNVERMRLFTSGNVSINSQTDSGYQLDVNGTIRGTTSSYFATSGGNVGIGTTSPSTKLDVSGVGRFSGSSAPTSGEGIELQYASSQGEILTYNRTSSAYTSLRVRASFIKLYGGGGAGGLDIDTSGNVGVGLTAPSERLHVSGNLRVTGTFVDSTNSAGTSGQVLASTGTGTDWISLSEISGLTGSGTTNYISKFSGTNSLGNSQIFDNGTFVGINTNLPNSLLDVLDTATSTSNSSVRVTNRSSAASLPTRKLLELAGVYNNGSNGHQLFINSTDSSGWDFNFTKTWGGYMSFGVSTDATQITRHLAITSAGDVGIGTVAPNVKLEIRGNTRINGGDLLLADTLGQTAFRISSYSNANSLWLLASNTKIVLADSVDWDRSMSIEYVPGTTGAVTGRLSIGQINKNGATWTHGITSLFTNGSERLRIDSSGNFGMNTTNPDSTTLRIVPTSTDVVQRTLHIGYNGSMSSGTHGSIITFGNTTPSTAQLARIGAFYEGNTYMGSLRFYTNSDTQGATPSERMRITQTGNVAIGLTAPAARLHVDGPIRVTKYEDQVYSYATGQFTYTSGLALTGDVIVRDGTTANFIFANNNVVQLKNTGVGTNAINNYAIASTAEIGASGANAHVYGSGGYFTSARRYSDDVGATSSTGLWGVMGRVFVTPPAPANIITGTVKGVESVVNIRTGSVILATGFDTIANIGNTNDSFVTNITDYYSILQRATIGSVAGGTTTITNYYGLYLTQPTVNATGVITNRWSIYSADAISPSYFAGNLLIKTTTNAGYALDVNGTIRGTTASYLATSGGSVGIGLTGPTEKLHVSGNLRVTGTFVDSTNSAGSNGQVLTSTGTGTDWKSLSEITGVDGTGTANYVAKWSDTDTIADSSIFDNGTSVGINNAAPSASARLEVSSTTQGFLPPRMTATQRGAISSPAVGLVVYQTDSTEGLWVYTSGGWRAVTMV